MTRDMCIVGVAMVKNEEDIVESFVRYHLSFLDGMLVLDNGSSDETARILASMRREGLPIHLRYDPRLAYQQAQLTTSLVREAVQELNADFVVVLDADEFLRARIGTGIRSRLETALKGVALAKVCWATYVPGVQDEDGPRGTLRANVLKSIQWRRRYEAQTVFKVIVSRSLSKQPEFELVQGNHDVVPAARPADSSMAVIEDLVLAHFPVRSYEQAESKYLVGWLGNLAREEPALFDWGLYYQRFKTGAVDREEIPRLAYFYNCTEKTGDVDLVHDPVPFPAGMRSVYGGPPSTGVLRTLLSHCESLASRIGGAGWVQFGRWPQGIVATLFDITLDPAALSLAEAATLFSWLAPDVDEEEVVVGEVGHAGELSETLRTIARAEHFDMRLVQVAGTGPWRPSDQDARLDRLVIHGGASADIMRKGYRTGVSNLRFGGGLALFDVLDTRSQEVRNLADSYVSGNVHWTDHRLFDRFFFATRVA